MLFMGFYWRIPQMVIPFTLSPVTTESIRPIFQRSRHREDLPGGFAGFLRVPAQGLSPCPSRAAHG